MQMTNKEIYILASKLNKEFNNCKLKLPIKINFFLQKNIKILTELAQEIEQNRLSIAQEFGKLNDEGDGYIIPEDQYEIVQQELDNLLNIKQEVNLYKFLLNDFNNIELTFQQMDALMLMINEQ